MGTGKVYLVGAGPGAFDLITLRGYRIIQQAEVLICDHLLSKTFLGDLGISTEGKVVKYRLPPCEKNNLLELNTLMCQAAQAGQVVVRLKGGDPLVFGRTHQEIEILSEQDIPWEVIPGPSVCTAALTGAGLPPTWRREGRSFAVVTARCAGGEVNKSYPRADSLIVFMGVAVLEEVAAALLKDGWPTDTPAALLERFSLSWEKRVAGELAEINEMAVKAEISSPALLVVGQAALPRQVFRQRPRILFTGLDPSNFRSMGNLLHWPALQATREEDHALIPEAITKFKHKQFDFVLFTSKLGVTAFFQTIERHRLDCRLLAGTRIISGGPGTDKRLSEYGLRSDAVAQPPGTCGIVRTFESFAPGEVMLVQGSNASDTLQQSLQKRGKRVTRLSLHGVQPHPELGRPLPEHDAIFFTSPSGVRAYWDTYGRDAFRQDVWCIGEITLAEVNRYGQTGKVVELHVSTD